MIRTAKILSIALLLTLTSCFNEDQFPETPLIGFEDLTFIDTETTDSLVLSFSFEDGGADIGLNPVFDDLFEPFQIYDFIIDANDSIIFIGDEDLDLPLYQASVFIDQQNGELTYFYFPDTTRLFSNTDNRPAYDCDSYEIIDSDTIYVARNEFHNNFHVEFQRKVGANFEVMDFNEIFNNPDCDLGQFDGRIPYFDPDGKSGTFQYAMISQAFRLAFLDDSIRLRFYVYDRMLNKSNEVITPSFLLRDITVNQ